MQAEQNKDPTERQMTKIAREAAKFTVQLMKADGIGTAEFDFIHLVRHNPGIYKVPFKNNKVIYEDNV